MAAKECRGFADREREKDTMSDLVLIDLYTENLSNKELTGKIRREKMTVTRRNCNRMREEIAGVTLTAAATSGGLRMLLSTSEMATEGERLF